MDKLLLLWDVDHTLIENSGVSKANYARAYELITGEAPSVQPATDGRTDLEVMRNLFEANDALAVLPDEEKLAQILTSVMKENLPRLMDVGYLLPGVANLLRRLSRVPNVIQSVLTGNIEQNAVLKLSLLGDDRRLLDFEVGGYGSDHIHRPSLVGIAQQKAARKYGCTFDRSSTVLVGDTTRDVAAALEGGAKVIAVATGVDSEETLTSAGADAVLPDLQDEDLFLRTLQRLAAGHAFLA